MKAALASTVEPRTAEVSRLADWAELVKVRLSTLVLLTTLCGFYLGSTVELNVSRLTHCLAGTALLAFGASALNQYQERRFDARMKRTADRPLPAARLAPETAWRFGLLAAGVGTIYLAVAVNLLTGAIGGATLLIYNLVYTPLKRITWLNTIVGAVPGALPPVMGWTAARGELPVEGWLLFAVLFFWQIPHFLAIAWLYREDYANAGFVMLPNVDAGPSRTGRHAVVSAAVLSGVSVLPFLFDLVASVYFVGSITLGSLFLGVALQFKREMTLGWARRLFVVSILYLPLLLGLMVWDKVKG
jgi:protoheme IX farnesyltransferase